MAKNLQNEKHRTTPMTEESGEMDKCMGCHFYDRQTGGQTDSRGIQWGQCRRSAPRLHPINQKTFMIEGVWPHVRDDDWCGEFRAAPARRSEHRSADSFAPGPLLPIAGSALATRGAAMSAIQNATPSPAMASLTSAVGRGDD